MTLFLAIILFGLILENNDLFALAVFENLCLCRNALNNGGADLNVFAVSHHQYVEIDVCTDLFIELFDHDLAANLNLVLLTAGYDDCVHYNSSSSYQSRPSGECFRITLNRFGAAQ